MQHATRNRQTGKERGWREVSGKRQVLLKRKPTRVATRRGCTEEIRRNLAGERRRGAAWSEATAKNLREGTMEPIGRLRLSDAVEDEIAIWFGALVQCFFLVSDICRSSRSFLFFLVWLGDI